MFFTLSFVRTVAVSLFPVVLVERVLLLFASRLDILSACLAVSL